LQPCRVFGTTLFQESQCPPRFAQYPPGTEWYASAPRTLRAETAIPPEFHLAHQQERFDALRQEFIYLRPHEAIGLMCPADRYAASPRTMPTRIPACDYPEHYLVRRVSRRGVIRVFCNQILVASPLMERCVRLEKVGDGVCDLFFCFHHIGRYHRRENKPEGVISRVNAGRRLADRPERVSPMSREKCYPCIERTH
jgi:hypothetical protein